MTRQRKADPRSTPIHRQASRGDRLAHLVCSECQSIYGLIWFMGDGGLVITSWWKLPGPEDGVLGEDGRIHHSIAVDPTSPTLDTHSPFLDIDHLPLEIIGGCQNCHLRLAVTGQQIRKAIRARRTMLQIQTIRGEPR